MFNGTTIRLTAYFSAKTTEARVLKEKSEKDMYVLIVEMKDPPKKTYLKMVFSGIRNSQANRGRMWKKVILRKQSHSEKIWRKIQISVVKWFYLKAALFLKLNRENFSCTWLECLWEANSCFITTDCWDIFSTRLSVSHLYLSWGMKDT